MTLSEFQSSLALDRPPADLSPALAALWADGRGNWDEAHRIAQEIEGPVGAWVHAYLHRKEGDVGNTGYWYTQAGRPAQSGPLDVEWSAIVADLLAERS